MGLNSKVALSGGAIVLLLGLIGFKAYRRYERSDEKAELDQMAAERERDSAASKQRLDELRAKISTIKTGLKACDTLMGWHRTPPTCRDAKASSEIKTMIEKHTENSFDAKSAAELEARCQATLDKVLEVAAVHGCDV
jgi:hypothetical protein